GRVDHPVAIELEAGDADRARAGGDDEGLGAVPLLADADGVGVDELGGPGKQRDLVALEQHADATGHLLDYALLEPLDLAEVDPRLGEGDAELLGVLGVAHFRPDMQQRLGGDAADVEAYASDGLLLDA